jgi:2,7-dihydroxy-5-methyl-1-naphthoate 7-O-methyltransferase
MKPKDVLGIPVIPPPALSAAGNRVRTAVQRVHNAMAPPPLRIIEGALSLLEHRVLVALCEVGVPDQLTGPTDVAELAGRIDVDAEALGRALRFGASRGWVRFDRRGRVRPSRVLSFLRRDHPGGWRAWMDYAGGEEMVGAVARFSLRRDAPAAFTAANGAPFFEYMAAHPDRSAAFNGAMAAGARMHALTIDAAFDWGAVGSVCDVGGGTGALLRVLLDRHRSLKATVLDLPEVVATAESHERLTALAGDAFVEVPGGFDVYLFVHVLHDWGDDDALRLMTSAARALGPDGRVIVLENDAAAWRHNGVAVAADLLMAALTDGGRERTVAEFEALGQKAGLQLKRTVPLASADVAHEFVAT